MIDVWIDGWMLIIIDDDDSHGADDEDDDYRETITMVVMVMYDAW